MLTKIMPQGFIEGIIFLIKEYYPLFLDGIKYTVIISLTGTLLGLLLALIITPIKTATISKRDRIMLIIFKRCGICLATLYVEILRGTPMMVQAVIFYYGLRGMGIDMSINLFGILYIPGIIVSGITIVSVNTSAYIIEVLRGSINAIDKGQMEAARSLGMTKLQALLKIIIPQALRNCIPAIGNEFVINIKDTSVLSVIAVTELFYMTKRINSIYYRQTEGFIIAAIIYLILTFTTTRLLYWISNKLGNRKQLTYPTSQSY